MNQWFWHHVLDKSWISRRAYFINCITSYKNQLLRSTDESLSSIFQFEFEKQNLQKNLIFIIFFFSLRNPMLDAIKLLTRMYSRLERYKKRHLPVDQITVLQCLYKFKRFRNKNIRLKIDLCLHSQNPLSNQLKYHYFIYVRTFIMHPLYHIILITYI